MISVGVAILVSVLCGLVVYYKGWLRRGQLPPGPWAWPLLGSLPHLSDNFHLDLMHYGEKYGDVFAIYLGSRLNIVLNSAASVREAFGKQGVVFAGRPQMYPTKPGDANFDRPHRWLSDPTGIFETYTKEWAAQKKFIVKALRNFDYGSAKLEKKMMHYVESVLLICSQAKQGEAVDICKRVSLAVPSIMFEITIGAKFDYNDEELLGIMKFNTEMLKGIDYFFHFQTAPILQHLPPVKRKLDKYKAAGDALFNIYQKYIDEHRNKLNQHSDDPQDLLDTVLIEIAEGSTFENCSDHKVTELIFSLMADAIDTAPVQIHWIILYTVAMPGVQEKVHKEIDNVLSDRIPSLADRASLPYCEAVIMESMRLSSMAPIGVPHRTIEDTTLYGYHIPAGTDVISHLWGVHHDHRDWDDPETFKPERFLQDGKCIHPEAWLPFSIGRRICMGEQLVRKQTFLTFTSLFQRYSLALDRHLDHLTGTPRGILIPPSFNVIPTPRSQQMPQSH